MASAPQPARGYPAATPIQIEAHTDFTGGLNLRASPFELAPNESPDMNNVDIDPLGGFGQRTGVIALNKRSLINAPTAMWSYFTTGGTQQLMVQSSTSTANQLAYTAGAVTAGAEFTYVTPDANACTGKMRAATFKDKCFIQRNAEQVPISWNGSAATALGVSFNDTLGTGADAHTNMPQAKVIAVHMGYVWVANTKESGTNYKSRLRWSHANYPNDWRTADYIDIDIGHDGDEITALVPFGDRLLVFKNNSIHAVYGWDYSSFSVQPVSQTVGCPSQDAVVSTEFGVYFFSWPDGVMCYTGAGIDWCFRRLQPLITNGTITSTSTAIGNITLGYVNRRVWLGLPTSSSSTPNVTYVLDPMLASRVKNHRNKWTEGGWMKYSFGVGPMEIYDPPGTGTMMLACHPTLGRVLQLESSPTLLYDNFYYPGVLASNYYAFTVGGSASCYTADSAANSITSDITVTVECSLDDWTPTTAMTLAAKWETTSNQKAWRLWIGTDGKVNFDWSNDGSTTLTAVSTVAPTITDGSRMFVRAALDVVNTTNKTVTFYTSFDGVTFTTLGSAVTTAGNTSVFNSTARVTVGADRDASTGQRSTGKFYSFDLNSGLPGSLVAVSNLSFRGGAGGGVTDTQGVAYTLGTVLQDDTATITSDYTTSWFDVGSPARKKRWKRPELVMKHVSNVRLIVNVAQDYDVNNLTKTFTVDPASTAITHTSIGGSVGEDIVRASGLGRSRAVCLQVTGDLTGDGTHYKQWAVRGITLKYIPRPIRP